jgi:GT2 family glycosyltransferase
LLVPEKRELNMAADSSLIIITLNRAALLRQTLEALVRQTRMPGEVVVVDNGPTEDTAETAEAFRDRLNLRYVTEPRRGYAPARNRGLAEAHGEILYFLDDDCVAEPDWAALLRKPLDAGEADLVSGARTLAQPGLAARLEYLSTDGPGLSPGLKRGPDSRLSTCNLALKRAVIEHVGKFDESLAMCEDRDFSTRARLAGFRLLFEPAARVAHYSGTRRFSEYLRRMRHYGFGTSQYFLRRRSEEPLARLFPESAMARLLLLPALATAGTGYLVAKNLPQCPDAVVASPLLLAGQFWWHWGGYEAMRAERRV